MCHLYSLRQPFQRILGAQRYSWQQWRRYRIFPNEEGQVIRAKSGGGVDIVSWGYRPKFARMDQRKALVRSEIVADRPGFAEDFRSRRCLVLADGFFIGNRRDGRQRWYFFQLPEARPFAFAGVWTPFREHQRTSYDSFAILTCSANATVGLVHQRMPVILGEGFHGAWLDNTYSNVEALKLMLRPWSDRVFEGWEVTPDLYTRPDLDYNPAEPIGPKLRARTERRRV